MLARSGSVIGTAAPSAGRVAATEGLSSRCDEIGHAHRSDLDVRAESIGCVELPLRPCVLDGANQAVLCPIDAIHIEDGSRGGVTARRAMRGRGCWSSVIPWVSGRRHRWGRSLRWWRRRPSSRHDVREFIADQGASRQPGRSWMHRSRRVGGGARRRVPQRFRWIGRQARGLLADSYCQHPTPNVQWTTPACRLHS